MKLVKLSLAAVVAAGAFSAANAVAFDEAIQNVELKGNLRYRFTSEREKTGDVSEGIPSHQFRFLSTISAEIADNFKAHSVIEAKATDDAYGPDATSQTKTNIIMKQAFVEYNNFDTKFKAGKMKIDSIWTDGIVGDGISVANNSIEGVTIAAFMFDNFDKGNGDAAKINGTGNTVAQNVLNAMNALSVDAESKEGAGWNSLSETEKLQFLKEATGTSLKALKAYVEIAQKDVEAAQKNEELANATIRDMKSDGETTFAQYITKNKKKFEEKAAIPTAGLFDHNLYGAAVIANFEGVTAQGWFAYLNEVGMFYAIDGAYEGEIVDDVNMLAHAQFAGNSLKGDIKDAYGATNGTFIGLEAGVETMGFDAKAGWVMFGKEGEATIAALHDKGQLINSGELAMDGFHGTTAKHNYFFAELGYTYEDLRGGLDLVFGDEKSDVTGKTKKFEVTPRLSYNYSKKLNFSGFYAYGNSKPDVGEKTDTHKIRFQAQYNF